MTWHEFPSKFKDSGDLIRKHFFIYKIKSKEKEFNEVEHVDAVSQVVGYAMVYEENINSK